MVKKTFFVSLPLHHVEKRSLTSLLIITPPHRHTEKDCYLVAQPCGLSLSLSGEVSCLSLPKALKTKSPFNKLLFSVY